jgi:hypothetical protein
MLMVTDQSFTRATVGWLAVLRALENNLMLGAGACHTQLHQG